MANQSRYPAVEVEFGGKTRHFIFDFNAKAELEDQRKSFASQGDSIPPLKMLRSTIWALLLAETLDKHGRSTKDTLSIQEVGEILCTMSAEDQEELTPKMLEAMQIAMPEPRPIEAVSSPEGPPPPSESLPPSPASN